MKASGNIILITGAGARAFARLWPIGRTTSATLIFADRCLEALEQVAVGRVNIHALARDIGTSAARCVPQRGC